VLTRVRVRARQINATGWSRLLVETPGSGDDQSEAWAAGYLEGYLTAARIAQAYANNYQMVFNRTVPPPWQAWSFLETQFQYQLNGTAAIGECVGGRARDVHGGDTRSPYWGHILRALLQVQGMAQGYNDAKVPPSLTLTDFLFLNAVGVCRVVPCGSALTPAEEMGDVIAAVVPGARPPLDRLSPAEAAAYLAHRGHCSVLIKARAGV
jgi:hypothetical protein